MRSISSFRSLPTFNSSIVEPTKKLAASLLTLYMEMISRTQLIWTTRIAILFIFRFAVYNCFRSPLVENYVPGSDQARILFNFNFTEFFHGRTLYVLGDSTVAAGNFMLTKHPYGVDSPYVATSAEWLPTGTFSNDYRDEWLLPDGRFSNGYTTYGESLPTGRFSNGYTIADYIAIRMGSSIPRAFSGILEEEEEQQEEGRTGINFASAGCGILTRTPQIEYWSLSDQILHLIDTSARLDSAAIGGSIFFLSVGREDYISGEGEKSYQYTKEVVTRFEFYLKSLYSIVGARRFIVNNLAPMGCFPDRKNQSTNICDDVLNWSIGEFNKQLELALRKFKKAYNVTIVLADTTKMFFEIFFKRLEFGFTEVYKPCCGEWDSSMKKFQCEERSHYCRNRNEYFFFDGAHTTDKANRLFVDNCLAGRVCYPIHAEI